MHKKAGYKAGYKDIVVHVSAECGASSDYYDYSDEHAAIAECVAKGTDPSTYRIELLDPGLCLQGCALARSRASVSSRSAPSQSGTGIRMGGTAGLTRWVLTNRV